ncbi:MAG: hypothetical protein WC615_00115 [Mucilaginibacter sp.]|jgi:hypothetical protein|uniref:hypothetical protein n=1 Tax=Mucilaginibacter sp. TaxID=1882438 RepID=UPI00356A3DFF
MAINSIQSREIEELSAEQLTRLLQMLLCLEVEKKDLQGFYYVSRKITTADGGEDGRITVDDIKGSNWLGNKLTLFQCKATNLIPSKIEAEFIEVDELSKAKRLKPILKEVLDNGGDYNLFMSVDASTRRGIEHRIDKMIEVCENTGAIYKRGQFKVYDANKIAEWSNEYISTVAYVLECNGKSRPDVFRTWQQWGLDYQTSLTFKFEDAALQKKISEIKSLLKTETSIRVIGHSGIGKTRLVYEIFNLDPSNSDLEQNKLNAAVVYYDYGLVQGNDLIRYVLDFKDNTVGIIVVDNCPNDQHVALASLVRNNSKLKIISIDFTLETEEKNVIRIDKDGQKETVKLMLKNIYPFYADSEINRLVELAEGYPKMVELLQEAIAKNGANSINAQLPQAFIEKLVFGHERRNDADFNFIKACSIFSEFNFIDEEIEELIADQKRLDEYKVHRDFIASFVCDPAITDAVFYRTCRKFKINRKILERRGYTLTVVPTPLAANLAAQWILDYPPDKFQEFCNKLIDVGLIDAFCKRLRSLDQIERAKSLVSKLWGPQGPFASAEVLNTDLGSRLFRSVVEVNPEATVSALVTLYGNYSITDIKAIDKGRRNLIWSLEKLAFRKETYDDGIIIMGKFAAGEIETFGNNATNQFLQTFHIFLPGTEVPLERRLSVLEQLLTEEEPEYISLTIKALGQCLKSHGFSRMGGADDQGSATKLVDYMPQSWDEIYNYWRQALNMLLNIVRENTVRIAITKPIIEANLRGIFGQNQGNLLTPILTFIKETDSSLWEGAINALQSTLKYEKLDDANRDLANQLIASLMPQDWSNKVKYVVSVPAWDYSDPDAHRGQDRILSLLRQLLNELHEKNILPEYFLPQLLSGEQRRGILFGRILAENKADQYRLGTLIFDQLRTIDKSQRSTDVLAGFLSAVEKTTKKKLFDELLDDEELNYLLFTLLRFGQMDAADITKLFVLVERGIADITAFTNVIYHIGQGGLSVEEVIILCDQIRKYGNLGNWTAFSIYHHLSYSEIHLWNSFKSQMRALMIDTNFLALDEKHSTMDLYMYTNAAQRIFKEHKDEELAIAISDQIAESLKSPTFASGNYQLEDLIEILITEYFTILFDRLSPALISKSIEYWNVKTLLGSRNGNLGNSGLLFKGDTSKIIEWCDHNIPTGPERIAYMMPVFSNETEGSLWHPFARLMIDRFYKVPGLLNEIGANMGSFGWVGSSVPYFEKLSSMMNELFDHNSIKVRKWAKSGFNHYQKQIKLERLNDEQDRIS